MSTAFSQIVGAIIGALSAVPPVCDTIDRARGTAISDQVDQAVSVQWERTLPDMNTIAGAPIDWQTTITVACLARSTKDSGDVAVDGLLSAIAARLAQDTTLGGLVADLRIVGIEAENTVENKKTGWVLLTYVADHRTTNSNLS